MNTYKLSELLKKFSNSTKVRFYTSQPDGVMVAYPAYYLLDEDGLALMDAPSANYVRASTGGVVRPIPLDAGEEE